MSDALFRFSQQGPSPGRLRGGGIVLCIETNEQHPAEGL